MKWIYKRVVVEESPGPIDNIEETLNTMGNDGWELKASYRIAIPLGFAQIHLLFGKKEIDT
jgi:hypothetical protein